MKKITTLIYVLSLMIFFNLSINCKKSSNSTPSPAPASTPGANEVWMQNTTFNPISITVSVNTTVKWTNKDGVDHTVTSNTGLFDSGTIHSGGIYSHQFTATGTFPYRCTFHSNMTGTVIVQ